MTQQAPSVTPAPKSKKTRSPAYPGVDLEEALQKAELVRTKGGKNAAHIDTILSYWGHKPKSGAGMVALSALIKFGLMADGGSGGTRTAQLTPVALKILLDETPESPERLALIREAALAPTIHKELWAKYQGALPSDLTLRTHLRTDRGFQDRGADELITEFRKTLAYARLPESGTMSPSAHNKIQQPEGEPKMTPPPAMAAVSASGQQTEKKPLGSTPSTRTVQIPLTNFPWAMLQVPYPMTAAAYKELMDTLRKWARPLTDGEASGEDGQPNS